MAKKSPPPAVMLNLIIGYWVSRLIYVAAKLELADHLNDGPRTVEELAMAAGVQAPALYRVLRALASVGVFEETRADSSNSHRSRRRSGRVSPARCAPWR